MLDPEMVSHNTDMNWLYDREHDILYVYVSNSPPSYSDDEEVKGVYIKRSMDDDDFITGVTIMDYSKRNRQLLRKSVPFYFDFDAVI